MLTAHLPSGYCLARLKGWQGATFASAIAGAVLPDADLLFFYFIDDKAFHHHRYWVHIPLFWVVVASIALPLLWKSRFRPAAIAFFSAILMHLLLDSLRSGGIMWLAPFSTELLALVSVPPTRSNWILSSVFHWTFLLEIVVWVLAGYLYLSERKRGNS